MTSTLQRPTERSSTADITTWQATKLVAAREIKVRLRDRAFIISGLFMLVLVAGATILPALFSGGPTTVAAVGSAAQQAAAAVGAEVQTAPDVAAAETLVRNGDVDAALIPDTAGGSPSGLAIIALDDAPGDLLRGLSIAPPVQLLEPSALDPALAFLIPFAFGMVFFMTSLTFGLSISQSVVEEKQTRIVEILVAAMPVRALLAGKVLGNTVLALGQIVLIVAAAIAGLMLTGSELLDADVLAQLGTAIAWFVPFFLIGFIMLAGLWAVAGALVTRLEDLGSTTMPIQMLVMLPFFAAIFGGDQLLGWLSYVPFSAPTTMPIRIFKGDTAGLWEPLLSLGILAVTAMAFVLLAARLYEGSLLRTNSKTSIRQAWRTGA